MNKPPPYVGKAVEWTTVVAGKSVDNFGEVIMVIEPQTTNREAYWTWVRQVPWHPIPWFPVRFDWDEKGTTRLLILGEVLTDDDRLLTYLDALPIDRLRFCRPPFLGDSER